MKTNTPHLSRSNQITNQVLMIRPSHFGFNQQTADSNAFQSMHPDLSKEAIIEKALAEFDQLVFELRSYGVAVLVISDDPDIETPDSIFPNNWISFHDNGIVLIYPMQAEIRRLERREAILEQLSDQFDIQAIFSLTHFESINQFLEGTGSLVMDRVHKTAYACLSPRTHLKVLEKFCLLLGYQLISFRSYDLNGQEIYHTNVMMAIGETFVILAAETISNRDELDRLKRSFIANGKEIIEINSTQVLAFAGNMLEVRNKEGKALMVMSSQAFQSLVPEQVAMIEKHAQIVHSDITTIEKYGGGSARCMMAEVFLPKV